ncbi:unnamed protein product [Lactuca virosa]|uniref:Uncharacterized protein n=1 Tax=Lactuca virosa TaxID=75947 RepID=A0AAU9MTM9_9ASTR|nr:unnamed protein product [Lactuca virosa]
MAMAGNGRTRYEGGGADEKSRKWSFSPEINEDLQTAFQEAGQNNSTSISAATGIAKLQQIWKHFFCIARSSESFV